MTTRTLRVASCQYPVEAVGSMAALQRKLTLQLTDARDQGAHVVVMPEYAGLELLSLLPDQASPVLAQFQELQQLLPEYHELCRALAQRLGVYLLAGSVPVLNAGVFVNRAYFHAPSGQSAYADKLQMTPFERAWGICGTECATVLETSLGKLGVAICYDSEFPLIARSLADAGAEVLVVPSCTDTRSGYHRVKIGCQARALENQCYVVQSVTVGDAHWTEAFGENHGAAGIYCPPDNGLPDNGVIASGPLDTAAWVIAELDLEALREVRASGQVRTRADWSRPEHLRVSAATIAIA